MTIKIYWNNDIYEESKLHFYIPKRKDFKVVMKPYTTQSESLFCSYNSRGKKTFPLIEMKDFVLVENQTHGRVILQAKCKEAKRSNCTRWHQNRHSKISNKTFINRTISSHQ